MKQVQAEVAVGQVWISRDPRDTVAFIPRKVRVVGFRLVLGRGRLVIVENLQTRRQTTIAIKNLRPQGRFRGWTLESRLGALNRAFDIG